MKPSIDFNFAGKTATLLHPAKAIPGDLSARLAALGVAAHHRWPTLQEGERLPDLLFVDVDTGHDEQFPWPTGCAPMPAIGLVLSESPGRLSWALRQRLDAFLPQAALGGVYSALVVAAARFAERQREAMREAEVARRASLRHQVIRAVVRIMRSEGIDEFAALRRLRALAMVERLALEDAACLFLKEGAAAGTGSSP
jgi:AmiR/NasT family two-component response regulator